MNHPLITKIQNMLRNTFPDATVKNKVMEKIHFLAMPLERFNNKQILDYEVELIGKLYSYEIENYNTMAFYVFYLNNKPVVYGMVDNFLKLNVFDLDSNYYPGMTYCCDLTKFFTGFKNIDVNLLIDKHDINKYERTN